MSIGRPPGPLLVARLCVLAQGAALVAAGIVLAVGAVRGGGLLDMAALGGFFVVLGLGVIAAAWRLGRGSGAARGFLVTVQVLLGVSLVALIDVFGAPAAVAGVLVCLLTLVCLLAPSTREFIGR